MSQQSLRQASIRAVTGTTYTYEGDWHALFDNDGIALGQFNERLLRWINARLGTSYTEINGAMAAMALAEGADSFQAIGTFSATGNFDTPVLTWDGITTDPSPGLSVTLDPIAASGDQIVVDFATDTGFTANLAEYTDALDAGEIAGGQVNLVMTDLTDGTWYARLKHTRASPAMASAWSNTVTITVSASRDYALGGVFISNSSSRQAALGNTFLSN